MGKKRDTKSRIAVAAWKLFREKGYEKTTVDDIIAKSKSSKGSFYHHFSNKNALLESLSDVFDLKYEDEIATLDPDMNSYDKLLELCFRSHQMIEEDIPLELMANLYASQVTTRGDKHLLNKNRYYFKIITALVKEGQARGQIRSDMQVTEIVKLYAMCERAIIYDYCISGGTYSLAEYTKKAMPLLFGCIAVQPE